MNRHISGISLFTLFASISLYQPVYADSACEDNCASQQDTCMNGCTYLTDEAEQNSCVRGCLSGGSACARRCRQQDSSFMHDFDKKLDLAVNEPVSHGTHLCSDDEHCGSGHKCCSGHCKAVDTCYK